jgi:hypothetical protein|tara:strand:- start:385 stop:876 length:492 start_codon:yes stop_codon:yes gene_type:complete
MQITEAQKYLPPELLLDEYHPANTPFFKNLRQLEQALVAASHDAGARGTAIAKMHLRGMKNVDIAKEFDTTGDSISHTLHSKKVAKITSLLFYLQQLREGPNLEQRKRTLWEITQDNQHDEPKTSISAIQEMNRMDGIGKDTKDTKIEVTINNQLLPKGALDQ